MPSLPGLSSQQASQLLETHGPNTLPRQQTESWWHKLLREFTDLMVIILILAALVAFALGEEIDAIIIFVVVVLNALIGFFQEWKSEKTLEALQKMVSPEATVFRDGVEQQIEAQFLVPGDIITIREGDRIPADGKVVESFDLKAKESALTGESVSIEKQIGQQVFLGTAAVYGSATVEVTATGAQTKFGNIAKLTLGTKTEKSPLQKELFHVGVFVGKVTGVLVIGIFLLDFFVKKVPFVESLLFSISVAVAAVPEGLPATITIALALGVQRLAQKKAVVKRLSSAETLGATTVICSDKTGTITRNEMTVTKGVFADGHTVEFEGKGWLLDGKIRFLDGAPDHGQIDFLRELLVIGKNCNDAKLEIHDGLAKVLGDPTEGALLVAAQKFLQDFNSTLPEPKLVKKYSFDSVRKMMSTFHVLDDTAELFAKGAPEMLIQQCAWWWNGNEKTKMDEQKRTEILQTVAQLSDEALRVLAFAKREFDTQIPPQDATAAEQDLVFYGLLGMIDPPRKAVPDAVAAAHSAGVRTIVITGDNPKTATAIARQVGIITAEDPTVLTGEALAKMSDHELSEKLFEPVEQPRVLQAESLNNGSQQSKLSVEQQTPGIGKYREILFARTAPEDKMRIVSLLQQGGEVVAVTGDGVNDAPALKKADIGVTMGITGTEVSKEAASMILLDDSFATIVEAIREGRKIFENLKKFLTYLFSGNIGELLVIITTLLIAVPAPLTAVLILLINLGTDVLPAIALSFEKAEEEIMQQPPRDPKVHILQKSFVLHFLWRGGLLAATVLGAFLWILFVHDWSWGAEITPELHAKGRTVAFTALVMSQMFLALSSRHFYHSAFRNFFENKMLIGAITISLGVVGLVLFAPVCNVLFKTTPLPWMELGMVTLFSSGVLWAEEVRKLFLKNKPA